MNLISKICLALLALFILVGIFAPFVAPFDPLSISYDKAFAPPSFEHFLGCDNLGRDIFSRVIYGIRISVLSVFVILFFIVLLGVVVGGVCGFFGGWVDRIFMRFCDVFLSFPTIALSLFFVGVLGSGLENVILAIILTHWAWYARVVRSIVLNLKNKEFVLISSRLLTGEHKGFFRIWRKFLAFKRTMLTPILSQMLILASLDISHMLLHISGLSFLGLGVTAPTPEWGVMIAEYKDYFWSNPAMIFYPGLALFILAFLCNLLGENVQQNAQKQAAFRDIEFKNFSESKMTDCEKSSKFYIFSKRRRAFENAWSKGE